MVRYDIVIFVASLLLAQPALGDEPKNGARADKALAAIQGTWERAEKDTLPDGTTYRKVKEIKGHKETVTVFDQSNKVVAAWTVAVKLETAGKVNIFSWSNMKLTAGKDRVKEIAGGASFAYRVQGDTFFEVWGLLNDDPPSEPMLWIWNRVKK